MREIPEFLKHLKTYAGFPVPFAQKWFDGIPDFRVIDPEKIDECIKGKLCAVCGVRLGEYSFFIGGGMCMANHLFSDPAMHKQCAEFTSRACPFVSGNRAEYSHRQMDETKVEVESLCSAVRPKAMYILKARTKKSGVRHVHGSRFIKAGPWLDVIEIWKGEQ